MCRYDCRFANLTVRCDGSSMDAPSPPASPLSRWCNEISRSSTKLLCVLADLFYQFYISKCRESSSLLTADCVNNQRYKSSSIEP
mmetsp:Transcript_21779/g.47217  ORF Transcript_21779/g.47217 Transcript_21779/m.47217 type:complete len:85 (+) Transcript_21779:2240-2494(+)